MQKANILAVADKSVATRTKINEMESRYDEPQFSKIPQGKCLSAEFSTLQELSPIYPRSAGVRRVRCGKEFDVKRQLFLRIPRRKVGPALYAEISQVVCPGCAAHLKSGKNIVTYA